MTIGIVTISFNQGKFLTDAIRSVWTQATYPLEYVIVDPGSTDNSRQIINTHKENFFSTVLEPDKGPADGLNKGFNAFQNANVCGYINADDRFTDGALGYVCKFFEEHPSIGILLGSIHIIDSAGRRKLRSRYVNNVTAEKYAEGFCSIWQQATFFRRSWFNAVGGFNTRNRTCWDSELVIDMLLAGAQIGYTGRALGEFRIHEGSLTGTQNPKHQALYEEDCDRLSQKIYSNRHSQLSPAIKKLARTLNCVNPYKQTANLTLGVCGVLSQKIKTSPKLRKLD